MGSSAVGRTGCGRRAPAVRTGGGRARSLDGATDTGHPEPRYSPPSGPPPVVVVVVGGGGLLGVVGVVGAVEIGGVVAAGEVVEVDETGAGCVERRPDLAGAVVDVVLRRPPEWCVPAPGTTPVRPDVDLLRWGGRAGPGWEGTWRVAVTAGEAGWEADGTWCEAIGEPRAWTRPKPARSDHQMDDTCALVPVWGSLIITPSPM